MQTYNFFENQYVGVADLMALQSVPQGAIKDILVSLVNSGVITGVGVYPTSPTASLAVLIETGKIILEDGSDITTAAVTELDLTSYVAGLTTGQTAYATIYAIPTTVSDTPVVTPSGTTIQYRTYDSVQYVVVLGTPTTGSPTLSSVTPTGHTGVLIADVLLSAGMTAINSGAISQSRMKTFVNIPYILGLIQGIDNPPFPISDITGLQAALDALMPLGQAIPESQVTNLTADLATLTSNVAALSSSLAAQVSTIDATLSSHAAEISTLNTEMAAANSELATHTSQINTLNSEVSANTSSIGTLNGEVSTLNSEMTTADSNITALQAFQALFTNGSNSNGYWRKQPDGFIEQWGQYDATNASFITFPVNYTNAESIAVFCQLQSPGGHMWEAYPRQGDVETNGFYSDCMNADASGQTAEIYWHAIGY